MIKIVVSESCDNFKIVTANEDLAVILEESKDSSEVPSYLIDTIEDGDNTGTDIYFWDMNLYLIDILRVLYVGGYQPIAGDIKVKKMRERQFKYLVTSDFSAYTITIRRHKRGVRIINASNICREVGDVDTLLGLISMSGERRKSCTISSIAKRIWTNFGSNSYHYLRGVLPNAIKVELRSGETLDKYVRDAYRGGFLCDNADLKIYDDVYVYDKNSLYPYVAANFPLPYGWVKYFDGRPSDDEFDDCKNGISYIFLKIKVCFRLKKDGIPCIRLKYEDPQMLYHGREYLPTTKAYNPHTEEYSGRDIPVTLTLTQDDFWLLLDNYDILKIQYIDYVRFPVARGLYNDFMCHFYEEKQKAGAAGDRTARQINKSLVNNCIGTTAKRIEYDNITIDFTDEEQFIKWEEFKSYGKESQIYIGAAVNGIARRIMIDSIKREGGKWLYSDTDCKHIQHKIDGEAVGEAMGEFKEEEHFKHAIYYKRKTYIGVRYDGSVKVVMAGVPDKTTKLIAKFIQYPPIDFQTRETHLCYVKLESLIWLFKESIPFLDYEEFKDYSEAFKQYCVRILSPLVDGSTSWQDMSVEQAEVLRKLCDVWIKHGVFTEEDIFKFIEEDTTERKLYSDFIKVFTESDTLQEILVKLYTVPIPVYETKSDGYFGTEEVVTYITLGQVGNAL